VWTNSNSLVENYGASLGIRYKCKAGYSLIANTTFAQLKKKSNDDGLEDGFNTPDWIFNAGISSIKISKDAYASFNYRWQSKYYWQSFLVNDWVAAYGTLDANINYKLPKKPVTFKLSASNILNNYYYSFTGGPHIGGMYLLTITYEK
jgi:iron complex outermembrane receptor protein